MRISEQNEMAGFYPGDEMAIRKLRGKEHHVPPRDVLAMKMMKQNARLTRNIEIFSAQLREAQSQIDELKNQLSAARVQIERQKNMIRVANQERTVRFVHEAKKPRQHKKTSAGFGYAARIRAKRF